MPIPLLILPSSLSKEAEGEAPAEIHGRKMRVKTARKARKKGIGEGHCLVCHGVLQSMGTTASLGVSRGICLIC